MRFMNSNYLALLDLIAHVSKHIKQYEDIIKHFIKELNPPTLAIRGVGITTCASIISEFGDINRFKSPDAILSFAGLEPSVNQSKTSKHKGKMVKHGSSHLHYALMLAAGLVFIPKPVFFEYHYQKRNEGKNTMLLCLMLLKNLSGLFIN